MSTSLDCHQYRPLVGDKSFVRLQVGDFYLRIERSEIEQGPVSDGPSDPIHVMGTADAERMPP